MKHILLLFILSTLMSLPEPEQIGICTNVTGAVYRSGKIRSGKIRKGESIYNGDKVFTMDKKAFLSLLNIQDKSIISLYGNSVIKIFCYAKKDSIKTEINIFGGRVSAELKKTKNSEYIINTPSSVAVVKGTTFLAGHRTMNDHGPHYQGVSDCVFSVLTGKLEVQNTKSGKTIKVEEGKTVISTSNGEFLIFETTDEFTQYFKEPK
jgi:hypothetical protein